MNISSYTRPRLAAAFVASLFVVATTTLPLAAQTAAATSTILRGTVTANGAAVANATVVLNGAVRVTVTTDANGRFTFGDIPAGSYEVDVTGNGGSASVRVAVPAAGAVVAIPVSTLKTIGRTSIVSHPPNNGSGTDLDLSTTDLTHSPANGSLSELLIQLPGAARGANGVVHINGDHGDINYIVDGVQIPQELNRDIGSEFDPSDIASVDVLEGAYPAQYGERFASVINIASRTGNGPAGYSADFKGGSYAYGDDDVSGHIPLGTGSLVAAFRNQSNNRFLDPPNFDSNHDAGSNVNQFVRFAHPIGTDYVNVTLSHSFQTFQIPNDIANGEPSATDDNETQEDFFGSLQYRHPFANGGSLSFGPSYKRSRIRDHGDPTNDFAFGEASNPGAATDCAQALTPGSTLADPTANSAVAYSNASCGFSLNADRTAIDVGGNVDLDLPSAHNDVKAGAYYDATHVAKTYGITLQPGNYLAPLLTPATPDAPATVVDGAPNVGHLAAFYLQNGFKFGAYQLDVGVRQDAFSIFSTQFHEGYAQTSPRIKLTRAFGARDSAYVFYGRFFTPFSLENVSPQSAYLLDLPLNQTLAAFDLKPQRDSDYEIGGHIGLGRAGDLGVRVMQKNATDLIDDTQVGVTNLHQDINYQLGRIATQTAYYQYGLARGGRFYLSATHTYSVNKGCETQLLAPCFGSTTDWSPADHDQRVEITSGITINDAHAGYFAIDGEYGSGLSSSLNPTGGITCAGVDYAENVGGPCKRTPHVTLNAEKGIGLGHGTTLTARIRNIFNDRYIITLDNAQGLHYAQPRLFDVGLRFAR